METRPLCKDGPEVSTIGFGAWPIGGGMGNITDAQAIATIHAAIDNGITFIDTAQAYRRSEEIIGKALQGGKRNQVFLATKVSGDYSHEGIRVAMENSLRMLQTDCVDLYQIHGWNPQYPIEESMAAMQQLQDEGKTRFIGVSNFNREQMIQAWQTAPFATNQPRYNLLDRSIEKEDLPHCLELGIGVLAHSPLAKGLLTRQYAPGHVFPEDDERSRMTRFQGDEFARNLKLAERWINEVAAPRGLTPVQFAIGFTLQHPAVSVCLVGAKSPEQIAEHVGGQGWKLTDDELRRIDEIGG